ncbi:MAG: hypothetical protein MPL62_01935 [Alphaproteobacteria bacterium]|nr:hypothetical protein [Alphaproteobacteria bacterium]
MSLLIKGQTTITVPINQFLALVGVVFRHLKVLAQASDASRWVRASPQKIKLPFFA